MLLFLFTIFSTASAQPEEKPKSEIGLPFGGGPDPEPFLGIKELDTSLDFSFMYSHLREQEMAGTYTGVPQISAGISFAINSQSRFFMSLGYLRKKGDAFWDIDEIEGSQDMVLQAIPFTVGVKTNVSSRKNFKLYFGAAAQLAYAREKLQTATSYAEPITVSASGVTTGYYLFMGPEIPLGRGNNALGAEFGIGGTKGEIHSGAHHHDVNLIGYTMKIYYTIEI